MVRRTKRKTPAKYKVYILIKRVSRAMTYAEAKKTTASTMRGLGKRGVTVKITKA